MKLIAIANVVAWGAFWTFGLIALFVELARGEMLIACLLAGLGFLAGVACHLGLCNRIAPTQRIAPQIEG
ncbi:hypothetical protein [Pseudooceanicola sp. 200-1SW]|uniref:hypothetical protein n=1 Tax=Pseudooceanicola sp. 200-1SW TaxID=3425949 RepID=UPI003D7F56C3